MTACFTCPHCGDPFAWTKDPEPDFHAGATYVCDKCDGEIIMEVFTVDEYVSMAEYQNEWVHASFAETYLRKLDRDAWWIGCGLYAATFAAGLLIGWWLL